MERILLYVDDRVELGQVDKITHFVGWVKFHDEKEERNCDDGRGYNSLPNWESSWVFRRYWGWQKVNWKTGLPF